MSNKIKTVLLLKIKTNNPSRVRVFSVFSAKDRPFPVLPIRVVSRKTFSKRRLSFIQAAYAPFTRNHYRFNYVCRISLSRNGCIIISYPFAAGPCGVLFPYCVIQSVLFTCNTSYASTLCTTHGSYKIINKIDNVEARALKHSNEMHGGRWKYTPCVREVCLG